MSEVPGRKMKCDKCQKVMPGIDVVLGHCAIEPSRLQQPPGRDIPGYYGGYYQCPHCGAKYMANLMPYAGDPSPWTALYHLVPWSGETSAGTGSME